MKGYKIGLSEDPINFVLIELDIPEKYPGAIVYEYIATRIDAAPLHVDSYTSYWFHDLRQYRSNVARILDIRKIEDGIAKHVDSAFSLYDQTFYYHPGEIIFPKAFDLDCTNKCSDGIHFFETEEEAVSYATDPWPRRRRLSAILARNNAQYRAYLEADAK